MRIFDLGVAEQFIIYVVVVVMLGVHYRIILWLLKAFRGEKCEECKKRSLNWQDWEDVCEEKFEGYDWCPKCGHKQYFGLYGGFDSSSD